MNDPVLGVNIGPVQAMLAPRANSSVEVLSTRTGGTVASPFTNATAS